MKILIKICCLSALLLLASVAGVNATLSTMHLSSDSVLVSMLTDTIFVAEGRIGDNSLSGTFEIDLGKSTSYPEETAQYIWPNGIGVPFTLTWNHLTNTATFTVGTETLVHTSISPFTDIFVRARAVNASTSVTVSDLVLDGEPVLDSSSAFGPNGLDILWIIGGELSDGFTLTGTAVMSWTGSPPSQSRLAFQVKTVKLATVPVEDTSWGQIKALFK